MPSDTPHHEGTPKAFDIGDEVQFKPSELNIVWGSDRRYWNVPENGADEKPAELLQVCWLEVTGSAKNIDPKKDYEVIFKLSLTPDAFGWGSCPVYLMVKRGKNGRYASKRCQLGKSRDSVEFEISCKSPADHKEKELYFGLYEVWTGRWKGGLQINCAIVKELPAGN